MTLWLYRQHCYASLFLIVTVFTGMWCLLLPPPLLLLLVACRGALGNEWGMQLLVMLPLAYICFCTYFALFRYGCALETAPGNV